MGRHEEDETFVVPDIDHSRGTSSANNFNGDTAGSGSIKPGTRLNVNKLKTVGPFVIGQQLGSSAVSSIEEFLTRIPNDLRDKFYTIKMLTLPNDVLIETKEDVQGKTLIHTEYSLLSMLIDVEGVIQCHGLFKDKAQEEIDHSGERKIVFSGNSKQRVSLVLDCLYPHEYKPDSKKYVNLQKYVVQEKQLSEKTSLKIFYHIVRVVEELHKRNIVHRDLKLGNIILDCETKMVTLINFGLGEHLLNDYHLLMDQCGSPAYLSPEILSGNPYQGKPSDIWSLGVVLYTMVYGQFPFYDPDPRSLLNKIRNGRFSVPSDLIQVSQGTIDLISKMLSQNPKTRLTASQALNAIKEIIRAQTELFQDVQVVPDLESRSKLNFVVGRLEAFKKLTRRPANVRDNILLTSVSNSSSNIVARNMFQVSARVTGRSRESTMGPPRIRAPITDLDTHFQ